MNCLAAICDLWQLIIMLVLRFLLTGDWLSQTTPLMFAELGHILHGFVAMTPLRYTPDSFNAHAMWWSLPNMLMSLCMLSKTRFSALSLNEDASSHVHSFWHNSGMWRTDSAVIMVPVCKYARAFQLNHASRYNTHQNLWAHAARWTPVLPRWQQRALPTVAWSPGIFQQVRGIQRPLVAASSSCSTLCRTSSLLNRVRIPSHE